MRRIGIYLRVSTSGQTTENQRLELEAVAARSGWQVVLEGNVWPIAGVGYGSLTEALKHKSLFKVSNTYENEPPRLA